MVEGRLVRRAPRFAAEGEVGGDARSPLLGAAEGDVGAHVGRHVAPRPSSREPSRPIAWRLSDRRPAHDFVERCRPHRSRCTMVSGTTIPDPCTIRVM